jgi:outer membrane translocation and assembly module TamA
VVLAMRLKVGAILTGAPEAAVPLTRRFYAGGSNSVRGYAYDTLGPLSPQGVLLGGEGLLEASVELRFPLRGSLRGVAFVDGGDAFRKPFRYSWEQMYGGAGVGVRYVTPVGPIGLDVAWKLREYPLDPSPYMVHFFIGYAF